MGHDKGSGFKYSKIYDDLHQAIVKKKYPPGAPLPSEIKLAEMYAASRPTIARALADLQKVGLVERRVGSGTYVIEHETPNQVKLFGLLIPGLGKGEIFEPICSHMAELAENESFTLLWGGQGWTSSTLKPQMIEHQCQLFIQKKVDGIFFNPMELISEKDTGNVKIAEMLDEAGIPVILLDQDIHPFPQRSGFDLVGINNYQSGFIMTRHLLELGCQRIDFVARPYSASTVDIRIGGYHEALLQAGIQPEAAWLHRGDPDDPEFVRKEIIESGAKAVICANDATAAALMDNLDEMGVRIPRDMRLVGFDDVKYSKHLRVPLTTYRQPLSALAMMAVHTMMTRMANPDLPPRTIYLDGELIVRRSSAGQGSAGRK